MVNHDVTKEKEAKAPPPPSSAGVEEHAHHDEIKEDYTTETDDEVDDYHSERDNDDHKDKNDHNDEHNDHNEEHNDDHNDIDHEDEEDEKNEGIISELKEMWQQHLVAILVAVVATFFAHQHFLTTGSTVPLSPEELLVRKHPFLVNYQRSANLTFCPSNPNMWGSHELHFLEFELSKEHMSSMARHWAADLLQDDFYTKVLQQSDDSIVSVLSEHEEYHCWRRQMISQKKIQGHSYFYSSPTVHTMYELELRKNAELSHSLQEKTPKIQPVQLTFTGFAIKITNLSRKPVLLYWEGHSRKLVGEIGPYESLGTASQSSGQTFLVTPVDDPDKHLHQWIVTADTPILYYEPKEDGQRTFDEQLKYDMHLLNRDYELEYSIMAKRPWLAHFPRPLPVHFFWPAKFFGQTHSFSSDDGRTYEMTVASVTPRVFTIPNFLTKQECRELVLLAKKEGLEPSTLTSGSAFGRQTRDQSTRSSSNTWVPRSSTELADQIYRRAAHVLQIDEGLLQKDFHDHPHLHSLAESLQVVRYKKGEEYSAHHDFVYPPTFHRHQPTRFATLLLYLNEKFEGGETVFPRAVNTQFHEGITITPQQGMAVLFYNMLPDGNMDDLSQHMSKPVEKGEKWLANLWVWEPHIY